MMTLIQNDETNAKPAPARQPLGRGLRRVLDILPWLALVINIWMFVYSYTFWLRPEATRPFYTVVFGAPFPDPPIWMAVTAFALHLVVCVLIGVLQVRLSKIVTALKAGVFYMRDTVLMTRRNSELLILLWLFWHSANLMTVLLFSFLVTTPWYETRWSYVFHMEDAIILVLMLCLLGQAQIMETSARLAEEHAEIL